jgi:hypothetical protein
MSSSHPQISAIGQAEVVVVEFQPPALLATVEVERLDLLTKVGKLSQEKVPAWVGSSDADRKLAQAAKSDFAVRAIR